MVFYISPIFLGNVHLSQFENQGLYLGTYSLSHDRVSFGRNLKKKEIHCWSNFPLIAPLRGKCRGLLILLFFLCSPTLHASPLENPLPEQQVDELTLRYHSQPQFIVYIGIDSWYCTFYKFGQICHGCIYHCSLMWNIFPSLKILSSLWREILW